MFRRFWPNRSRRYGLIVNGKPVVLGEQCEHVHNNTVHEAEFIGTYACGHVASQPPGGACARCSGTVCQACLALCAGCGCALCPRDTYRECQLAFCVTCATRAKTVDLAGRFARAVLGLFLVLPERGNGVE